MDKQVFAFRVWVEFEYPWMLPQYIDHTSVINHVSAGKAKGQFYRSIHDVLPYIRFTQIRCRKIGAPISTKAFLRNAEYRGMPRLRCGDRVKVGDAQGVIVGHNSSANLNVLFDRDSRYGQQILNVHPQEIEVI